MKVLHVQTGYSFGGIQSMLLTLARERHEAPGMEPHFAVCTENKLTQELRATNSPVHLLGDVKVRYPWQVVQARRRLGQLLDAKGFDAVICHGSWVIAVFGSVAARHGIPLVYWMHNDIKVRHKNLMERWAARQQPILAICNSSFTAKSLPLHFDRVPPSVVIPCPVSKPAPVTASRSKTRAECDTTPNATVIIQVGRPEAWKGFTLLLEALTHLRDRPDWTWWIVGGPTDAEQESFLSSLQTEVQSRGLANRVRFLGHRTDVPELLAAADLFCQPNLTPEPFGIVFIEALYAGLPVVTTRQEGICDIIDETCGILVEPGDAPALSAALAELMLDDKRRAALAAQAPFRAEAVSSPGQVLPKVRQVLEQVVRKPRKPELASA
jgi:glycosyltransferase involved in cell wall biosynthesis